MDNFTTYDFHGHIINQKLQPVNLIFNRWNVPKVIVDKAISFAKNHSGLLKFIEEVYEEYSEEDLNINELLRVYQLSNEGYIKDLIDKMDTAGINVMNLLMLDLAPAAGYEDMNFTLEDQIKFFDSIPLDRFNRFVGYDPRRKDALKLVKLAINKYDFDGVKCYPPLGCQAKEYDSLFDLCQEENKVMIIHSSPGGIGNKKAYSDPKEFIDLHYKYPKAKTCYAHAGGCSNFCDYLLGEKDKNRFGTIAMLCSEFENVFFDLSNHQDMLTYTERYKEALDICMDDIWLGDRACFGSDIPLIMYNYTNLVDAYKSTGHWEDISNINPENFLFR